MMNDITQFADRSTKVMFFTKDPNETKDRSRSQRSKNGNSKILGSLKKELLINEVELLLAEKRTSLATLRTGIAMLPIPLSVFMVLITTSNYYSSEKLFLALTGITVFCIMLLAVAVYLISNSMGHIHRLDTKVGKLRSKDREIGDLIEGARLNDK